MQRSHHVAVGIVGATVGVSDRDGISGGVSEKLIMSMVISNKVLPMSWDSGDCACLSATAWKRGYCCL